MHDNANKTRVGAFIMRGDSILLMHRQKNGAHFFVFPGGQVEPGETPEEALVREVKEETNLGIQKYSFAFEWINDGSGSMEFEGQRELYYTVIPLAGPAAIVGEEASRKSQYGTYKLEWKNLRQLPAMKNVYPEPVKNIFIDRTAYGAD